MGCNCYGCCWGAGGGLGARPVAPAAPPSYAAPLIDGPGLCGELRDRRRLSADANHAYVLTCPLVVRDGAALYVEAGTQVLVAPTSPTALLNNLTLPASFPELLSHFDRRGAPRQITARMLSLLSPDDCIVTESEWASLEERAAEAGASAYIGQPGIIVEPGGQLLAVGSVDAPITFTLQNNSDGAVSDTDTPQDERRWGGLLLMGRAPVAAETNTLSDGCWSGLSLPAIPYGGSVRDESSGELRYVRVWHAQRGIALYGVGNGTEVDHCEVGSSRTDGFVFHGGLFSARHLSSLWAGQAGFRARAGFQGRVQFLFAMLGSQGRVGLSLGAEVADEEKYDGSPSLSPEFFSITLIGGGVDGRPEARGASLLQLGSHVAEGGAIGDTVLVHASGSAIERHSSLELLQAHPPPPPFTRYYAELVETRVECALQAEDGISQGVNLGTFSTANECAQNAGEFREQYRLSSSCAYFQHRPDDTVDGCMCCFGSGTRSSSDTRWRVYRVHPGTHPDVRNASNNNGSRDDVFFLSSSIIVADVNNGTARLENGQHDAAVRAVLADPGLFYVDASCLTLTCIRRGECSSTFDPLPSPVGTACNTPVTAHQSTTFSEGTARHEVGEHPFFRVVQCVGAFASWEPSDNWLAGWSSLFPLRLGESPRWPVSLPVGGLYNMTVDTAFLKDSAAVSARSRNERARYADLVFVPEQCATTAFSSDRHAFSKGDPIYWLMLRPREDATLKLSTCSTQPGVGFDTDLAVFELREPCTCSRWRAMAMASTARLVAISFIRL